MTLRAGPIRLVLLGGGGTAADVVDIVADIGRTGERFCCEAILDDDEAKWNTLIQGVPVAGAIKMARDMREVFFVNTLGSPRHPDARRTIDHMLDLDPARFATIIHPSACIAPSAQIQPGTIVYPGVMIMARARLGRMAMVLAGSVVNHDVVVGDYATVASNVSLSGGARVGECAYVGAASCIRGDVSIAAGGLVGMGSVVVRDVPPGQWVAGNPALPLSD